MLANSRRLLVVVFLIAISYALPQRGHAQEIDPAVAAALLQSQMQAAPQAGGSAQLPMQLPSTTQTLQGQGGGLPAYSVSAPSLGSVGKPTIRGGTPAEKTRLKTGDEREKAPPAESPFQKFVAQGENLGISTQLPLFGQQFFQQAPSTFAPVENVPVPGDYQIGPGDEIMLRAWGQVDIDYRATVDRYGNYYVPTIGNIHVAGLKFSSLRDYLRTAIGRVYQNFDLDVSMGQLRSIQVFVLGQASQPGTYTISSLSTLVNALFAAGGPSPQGSLRAIQLKRQGKLVAEFDLYDLLLRGDKSKDLPLLPGDVIFIPPVGPLAAVAGNVNVPAIYELKGPTSLGQLLDLAGGLASTAYGQKVNIERIVNRERRQIEELPLDDAGRARQVHDGDLVRVFAVPTKFDNAVTLRGNVAWPGRYPWTQGMRIKDLIPNKESLINQAYWSQLYSQIYAKPQAPRRAEAKAADQTAEPGSAAAQPGGQPVKTETATLGETQAKPGAEKSAAAEITRTLPEPNWDYAVIERINPSDLSTQLIPFNLGRALLDGDPRDNVLLQPGDVITIFSKDDVQVPEARKTKFVRLEGEVRNPGIYQVMPGDTLRTIIQRAGGLTDQAFLFGASLTRDSVRRLQQERLKETLDNLEQEINQSAARAAAQALSPDAAAAARAQYEAQRALLARLRQAQPQGRIVLGLAPDAHDVGALPELPLEDGDRLVVPVKPVLVNVMGTVYNQNAFIYKPKADIGDYLAQAGGPTRDGDKGSLYVIRADGSVVSNRQRGWFSGLEGEPALPGDTVVVPLQTQRVAWLRELRDITQIVMQIATTALIAVRL